MALCSRGMEQLVKSTLARGSILVLDVIEVIDEIKRIASLNLSE